MIDSVLVDANFFIALAIPDDAHHKATQQILSSLTEDKLKLVTNNYIYAESFTVTLIKTKLLDTTHFLSEEVFPYISIFHVPQNWEAEIKELFLKQNKYKSGFLSYSDSSLIVQARKQNITKIFTFDETFKQFSDQFDIIGI